MHNQHWLTPTSFSPFSAPWTNLSYYRDMYPSPALPTHDHAASMVRGRSRTALRGPAHQLAVRMRIIGRAGASPPSRTTGPRCLYIYIIGTSVSESHLGSSTRPLSVCLSVCLYIYISYVRHFWSRGPRATRKRKPAHLKFKGHMHACCIYVANASRAITTLIECLHMYSSSLITSSAG